MIDKNRIPQHIAIIMDGNGRWATEQGKPRAAGHAAGIDTVRIITSECVRLGVKYLTLYTFSTENWNRPESEIMALMSLLINFVDINLFTDNNVRFVAIGDRDRLSKEVQDKVKYMEDITKDNTAMTMVVALSYSSRWEITKAAKDIALAVKEGKLSIDDINEDTISNHLTTNFMPDPELLIRTGGEQRISNYLLWQVAYSELYYCDTYWPAFKEEDLHKAIEDYQSRQRRFGKTEAQVEEEEK